MSNQEQQSDELDALAAIYPSEFFLLNEEDGDDQCPKFSIKVANELTEQDAECDKYELELMFRLPKDYPDKAPEISIVSSENLDDSEEREIYDLLEEMIPENLGMVMVFTLVSRAFEWINELKDRKIIERREEAERKKREHEEMERKKFEGTRVTVESFIAWKLKFEAEMAALKRDDDTKKDSGKLTGKEMFLRDKNLIESDLAFADGADEGDDVKVDESLFQDLDIEDVEDDPDD